MKRGKLRDKFLKYRTSENKKSFRWSEIILFHFSDKKTVEGSKAFSFGQDSI